MEEEGIMQSAFSYVGMVWAGIAAVGWYILAVGIALFFASPYLGEKFTEWKRKKDEADYTAKYHKNPDLLEERLRKQEEARQKMQEKYNATAEQAYEMEEERKEAKRQKIANLLANKDGGNRLGTADEASSSTSSSSKLQNDYNPLMGDSSRGYRAPKRSCCGKGGCG